MSDDPRTRPPSWRQSIAGRIVGARRWIWGWLTEPAVLVYRREAHGHKRARVVIVESALFIREIIREFWHIEGTAKAAALAYTTLLSLIPLLVAFTQVLQKTFAQLFPGFRSQIDSVLNAVLPYQSPQLTYHLAKFAENASAASTLGAIVFLFVSFRLFLAVEGTVNQIWKVRSARGYRQQITAFTMLFFWGPLLMGLSFTTTAMLERNRYLRVLLKGDFIFIAAPIVVLFVAFTMLFWLVPSTRVRLPAAMVGALVTTILFSLVRWGFGIYAENLFAGNLNLIYGTVGLAIIFLVALEVMWVVILLGVQISYVWQNLYGVLRASEQRIEDEPRFDLYYALRALVEIARRFDKREDAPSSYRLAEQFGTTDAQMLRVLRKLEDGKLVKEIGGEWTGFVPGCDPDRITVEEVMAQVEGVRRAIPEPVSEIDDTNARNAVHELFTRVSDSYAHALEQVTVGQLVRELYAQRAPSRIEDFKRPQPGGAGS